MSGWTEGCRRHQQAVPSCPRWQPHTRQAPLQPAWRNVDSTDTACLCSRLDGIVPESCRLPGTPGAAAPPCRTADVGPCHLGARQDAQRPDRSPPTGVVARKWLAQEVRRSALVSLPFLKRCAGDSGAPAEERSIWYGTTLRVRGVRRRLPRHQRTRTDHDCSRTAGRCRCARRRSKGPWLLPGGWKVYPRPTPPLTSRYRSSRRCARADPRSRTLR